MLLLFLVIFRLLYGSPTILAKQHQYVFLSFFFNIYIWVFFHLFWESVKLNIILINNNNNKFKLIHGVSPSRRYGSDKRKRTPNVVLQGSTGSVTVTGDTNDDIPMHQLGINETFSN